MQKGQSSITAATEKEEAKHHPLASEIPTDKALPKERRYTKALMDVYAEDAQVQTMTEDDLNRAYTQYRPHFIRQRSDYFAAEAIRRGTRDFTVMMMKNTSRSLKMKSMPASLTHGRILLITMAFQG